MVEHYSFDCLLASRVASVMHFTRYYFSGNILKDNNIATVLDAGCGCGYGSDILSKYVPAVTGIDRGVEAIEEAKHRFSGPTYVHVPVEEFSVGFESVVAFEVLEHLDNLDIGFQHLNSLASKIFIFSVPYKQVNDGRDVIHNHFMLDESRFPSDVKFFYQTDDGIIYDYMPRHQPTTLIGVRIK